MKKNLTCILCPVGCEITVTVTGNTIEKSKGINVNEVYHMLLMNF